MMFRDAKLKIEQARMHDFLVIRVMDTRAYIERNTGRIITDEDFYAALAVAMMESRDNFKQTYLDHMARCPLHYLLREPQGTLVRIEGMLCRDPLMLPMRTDPLVEGLVPSRISLEQLAAFQRHYRKAGEEAEKRAARPPSKLHPLVQQDARDRQAAEGTE